MTRMMMAFSALLICMVSTPVIAQDVLGTGALDMGMLTRNNAETSAIHAQTQQRANGRSGSTRDGLSAEAVATCRNKARAAENMGRNHPKVRALYRLCAQAGY